MNKVKLFLKHMWKMVKAAAGASAGTEIFDKLEPEPEPHKTGSVPQHWMGLYVLKPILKP
jgi:hypothetical protein